MADASLRPRPRSPFWIWRWHVTMACSILHRVTGVALYLGALILAAWAVSLAAGPDRYQAFTGLMGSLLGQVVLFLVALSAFYHLANGVRHLVWDAGYGFQPKTADASAIAALVFAGAATAVFWVVLSRAGAS